MRFDFLFVFFLIFVSLFFADSSFIDFVRFYGYGTQFFVNSSVNVTFNTSVTYNGTEVVNNTNYCSGASLNVTPLFFSSYIVFNPLDAYLICPTVNCYINTTLVTPAYNNIRWVTSSYYNSLPSILGLNPSTRCIREPDRPEPWPLDFINAVHNTTYQYPNGKQGNAKASLYGYGVVEIRNGSAVLYSRSLDQSISSLIISSPKGQYKINASLKIENASIFVRTYELPSIFGVYMYDCIYYNDGKLKSRILNSGELNFAIYDGPSLSLTPLSQDPAVPGQSYIMVVNVTNNGDLNATINQVNISYSGGQIPVNDFSPSSVLAGQTVQLRINVTIPSSITPGTVIYPNVSISYNSSTPVVGDCGGSRTVTGSISTNGIIVGNVKPITLSARSSPSSILKEGNYYSSNKIITNITIRRDEPQNFRLDYVETNITLYYYNTTTQSFKLNASYTGISGSSGSYSSGDGNIRWSTASDGLKIQYNQTISNYLPGVYKINISSYDPSPTDDNGQPNPVTRTRQFYFVIFNASSCVKRI